MKNNMSFGAVIGFVLLVSVGFAVLVSLSIGLVFNSRNEDSDAKLISDAPPVFYCNGECAEYLIRLFTADTQFTDLAVSGLSFTYVKVNEYVWSAQFVFSDGKPFMVLKGTDKFWVKDAKTGRVILCTFDCSSP